ncbi:MAG TPA: hydrogenase maturation nickel metallochaperone HypA [Polyangiaceae bacterium]|nr:hydrogenase maturation nickel metallochaperone HypA [Polyangiaceae bacterium]
MHESSLARQLLKVVLERARSEGAARVLRVEGWVAETEALKPEALNLHFAALAQGSSAEGAALALEMVHVRAKCSNCANVYQPEHHLTLCPSCGGVDATLLDPTGVAITRLELE